MPRIPENIAKLTTRSGYMEEFENLMPHFDTKMEAYEHLEKVYFDYFGRERYPIYSSFVNNREKYVREQRKKARENLI